MESDLNEDLAQYQHCIELLDASQFADAEVCLQSVVARRPDFAEAHYHLGILLLRTSRAEQAGHSFRQAIKLKSDFAAAHNNLGNILLSSGRLAEAEACLRQAIATGPYLPEAYYNLGTVLLRTNRLPEAEVCLHQTIALKPDFADAYNNLCEILLRTNRVAQAQSCLRRAISIRPNFAEAHYNLGSLLLNLNRFAEAEACFRRAVAVRPELAEVHCALGVVLINSNRIAGARACFRQAIALKPDYAEAHYNLGAAQLAENHIGEAVTSLTRGFELDPEHTAGRLMLSSALLKMGRLEEGWPLFEARYLRSQKRREEATSIREGARPQWQGEPLDGKSLLAFCDYGIGDAIQFVRFIPALKDRGLSRLTVVCHPELKRLFRRVKEIDTLKSFDEHVDFRRCDFWCFLMSLPLHLGVKLETIPANLPYIHVPAADAKRWKQKLQQSLPDHSLKVGLAWAGNPRTDDVHAYSMDQRRSLSNVRAYIPLLQIPGIAFVNLQKSADRQAQLRDLPSDLRPFNPMNDARDFADTAAIITNLDLVITTDTSVVHLAAAMNKPVWVLLHFDACWRWLYDRDDSPWYPGVVRLFRQKQHWDWDSVIQQVAGSLQAEVVRSSST